VPIEKKTYRFNISIDLPEDLIGPLIMLKTDPDMDSQTIWDSDFDKTVELTDTLLDALCEKIHLTIQPG